MNGRIEVVMLYRNNTFKIHGIICNARVVSGECRTKRARRSRSSLASDTFDAGDKGYLSSALRESHQKKMSRAVLTSNFFKCSSPNIYFLASFSMSDNAGWVHFPPTLGVSGVRAMARKLPGCALAVGVVR